MLFLLYNKWFLSFIITLFLVMIIYYFNDSKMVIKSKKDKKNRNKYYIKIFIIIYLISVIIFYAFNYIKDKELIKIPKVFSGGFNNNIKIIDSDIDTSISNDW
jgi:archaellum biogenesis protein FlaJ (TadC family)